MNELTCRRRFLKTSLSTATAVALPDFAFSQAYPSRPIRLICPFTAGGSSDVILRTMAGVAGKILGGTVVVENKPGASGSLGALELATARPDGYILSQLPFGVYTVPHMQKVTWHPMRDISYIAHLTTYTNGLVVRGDSPIRSIKDFIDTAKARPGEITYGCAGLGTFAHLSAEEFAYRAGIKLLIVPYKGDADGLQALLGGHIMALSSSSVWAAQVDSGACRLLASYGTKRIKRWASAPTLREIGFDTIPDSPFGIGAPKGMAPGLLENLQEAFRRTLEDPSVSAVLDKYDMPVFYLGASDYTRFSQQTYDTQKTTIARLGLYGA